MPGTLGANDTREGIRKVYVVLVGVALKTNCLIHNFPGVGPILTHSTTCPGKLCNCLFSLV